MRLFARSPFAFERLLLFSLEHTHHARLTEGRVLVYLDEVHNLNLTNQGVVVLLRVVSWSEIDIEPLVHAPSAFAINAREGVAVSVMLSSRIVVLDDLLNLSAFSMRYRTSSVRNGGVNNALNALRYRARLAIISLSKMKDGRDIVLRHVRCPPYSQAIARKRVYRSRSRSRHSEIQPVHGVNL